MLDIVFQLHGDVEIKMETVVKYDWPNLKIPCFLKATIKSLVAKARFFYDCIDQEKSYL